MKKTNLVLTGALPDGVSSGAVVEVSPVEGNATPGVRAAVARLEDGGTLRFAQGEYHFFEEGAEDVFLASAGSSTGWKKAVFRLDGLADSGGVPPHRIKRPLVRFGKRRLEIDDLFVASIHISIHTYDDAPPCITPPPPRGSRRP